MFSLKNKLDTNLRNYITNGCYRQYRVLIKCKKFQDNISSKISSMRGANIYSISSIGILAAEISPKAIERLIEYPEVEHICLDSYGFLCGMSVSTANNIRLPERYKLNGKGVGIGLVDSGVYPHPDLLIPSNRIKGFVDLVNNFKYSYDDNGHGTFISGILCGSGYSSKNLYKGIADKSDLYCYKAFNASGKGYVSDILYAIESLINLPPEANLKILCLPFELLDHNTFILSLFENLFAQAVNKNIIPVVPSGSNINKEHSIAGIATSKSCITVAGLDTTKSIKGYTFSSCGPFGKLQKPDLAAASVNVTSLNTDISYISDKNGVKIYPPKLTTAYTTFSGTSCAAAYVSGLCALLLENNPSLTFKDICSLIKVSCETSSLPRYVEGEGIININKLFS